MTKNPVFHNCSKHIELKFHFIREKVKEKEIKLKFCKTEDQLADIFTKPISQDKFLYFRRKLGILEYSELRGGVGI